MSRQFGPFQIDLRERVVSFPPQPVITEDNLTLNIDTVVYVQVTVPQAAVVPQGVVVQPAGPSGIAVQPLVPISPNPPAQPARRRISRGPVGRGAGPGYARSRESRERQASSTRLTFTMSASFQTGIRDLPYFLAKSRISTRKDS